MANERYTVPISCLCFVLIFIFALIAVAYEVGVHVGTQRGQVVYPSIGYGNAPDRTPVWAVYVDDGRLFAMSAINCGGALREFNVAGGPVAFEPISPPDAWLPMSAEWSTFVSNGRF